MDGTKKKNNKDNEQHKPLYQKTTSHILQLLRYIPINTEKLSLERPHLSKYEITADMFYETAEEMQFKKKIIEHEISARLKQPSLVVSATELRNLSAKELQKHRSAEMKQCDMRNCIGDHRNVVVLPSLIGSCESKSENKVHTDCVLEILGTLIGASNHCAVVIRRSFRQQEWYKL